MRRVRCRIDESQKVTAKSRQGTVAHLGKDEMEFLCLMISMALDTLDWQWRLGWPMAMLLAKFDFLGVPHQPRLRSL